MAAQIPVEFMVGSGSQDRGLAGPLATGSFSGLEGLVPQAGGHTPHLLQGLNPLFQEPVLSPKPLCGERGGMLDRASYFSCTHRGLSPEGPGHL